jgi:hypothetical protein
MSKTGTVSTSINFAEWSHHHGVITPLLDLESRDYDPVGVMEDVNTLLEGTPKTATRINAGKINKELGDFHIGFGNLRKIDMIMAIHGAWQPPCETTGSSRVYINPTYIHQDHLRDEYYITDAEDRREWLDFVFEHGLVEKDTVATQFGMSTEDFQAYLSTEGIDWDARQDDGLQRLVQTWETMRDWGYDEERLASAFNIEYSEFQSLKSEYLPDDYFIPCDVTVNPQEASKFDFTPDPISPS